MAKRTTSVRRKGSAELARETNLGRQLLALNDDEVVQLLKAAVEREGDQGAFARRFGIERTGLNMMLNRRRPLSRAAVVKALALRKVYTLG
jgi:DNA-binding phage protein